MRTEQTSFIEGGGQVTDIGTPYSWSPGTTRLQADGKQPTLCLIFDGEGIYQGMMRVGESTLQYAPQRYDEARKDRRWIDATERWPAFPPWLRRQVTDALHLHAVL